MNKQHFIKKLQVFVQFNTLPLQKVQPDREDSLMLPRVQKEEGNKKEINPDTVTMSVYRTCMQGNRPVKH